MELVQYAWDRFTRIGPDWYVFEGSQSSARIYVQRRRRLGGSIWRIDDDEYPTLAGARQAARALLSEAGR